MKERPNLTQFMEQLIRALKEEERFSTAHIYQSTLNALRLFCKADVIRFNQMDRSRLKQFESHSAQQGMCLEYRFHLHAYFAEHVQQSCRRRPGRRKAPPLPPRIYRSKSQHQTRPRCRRHE